MARKGAVQDRNQGYIFLHREVRDHWLWQDPVKFQWWVDIIMECNHTACKVAIGFELMDCDRGQSLNSLPTWSKRWRVDVSTVRRFLDLLERESIITRENLGKTTRLTVCEYDTYNNPQHATQSQRNGETTGTQWRRNTNKNEIIHSNNKIKRDGTLPGAGGAAEVKDLFGGTTPPPGTQPEKVTIPWSSPAFAVKWQEWLDYRVAQFGKRKVYKTVQSQQLALKKLYGDANGDEATAIRLIDNAMANTWQGIYPQKNQHNNGTSEKPDITNNQPGSYTAGWAN